MRVALKVGSTIYPLAGQAGVDERTHSSASNFTISAQSVQDLIQRVRAASAQVVDRGNLSTTIRFSTTRVFATPAAAFLYSLDHDSLIPRQGVLVLDAVAPGGAVSSRWLMDMVINPPLRRVIGCTVLLDYTATGGAIVNEGLPETLTVTGSLTPDATGVMTRVATPWSLNYPGGWQWSSNGNAAAPGSGAWKDVYQGYLVTPSTTTLNALAPKGGYVATGLQSTASRVLVATADFASSSLYWLYDDAGTARWVLAGDGALASRDAVSIPAGRIVFPEASPGVGFVGGLGATWQTATDVTWLWVMRYFSGVTQSGTWSVQGQRPNTTGWAAFPGFGSGTPTVIGS